VTGNVRVIDAAGSLVAAPAATIAILTGSHQGLLGLAVDPQFASNGYVYVFATVPAAFPHADRSQVLRLTMTGNTAGSPLVLVDDLPVGTLDNGGELAIGPADGMLYATIGDTNDAALAQTDGVIPGRVLRYTTLGAIPADNPIAGSPEWCRGIRNTFGLAFHPTAPTLLGADNGPANNDHLNLIAKGRDCGWPNPAPPGTGAALLRTWVNVIAPTSLTYYTGGVWGTAYDNNVFLTGYVDEELRRLAMSGATYIDVDSEEVFAHWIANNLFNKPLDVEKAADGTLYVSTFDSIYRIRKSL
jgi:glucose/arabinose dehydrogenase